MRELGKHRETPDEPQRPSCAQPGIPADRPVREHLRQAAKARVAALDLVPPLTADELATHAQFICEQVGADPACRDYAAILVNNAAWRDTVAGIPYSRRLLLLPQCLRDSDLCRAPIDELGLLCQHCGRCPISNLQTTAEELGYAVLVAEGSAVVTEMIATGQIQAIVGVSCMSVLEKCFPHMEARAVPGLAIPLLRDGCVDTNVDLDWVQDAVLLRSNEHATRIDLAAVRDAVQSWHTLDSLTNLLGPPTDQTEQVARDWLARAGKRWRPYLTACVYRSLVESEHDEYPDNLKRLALAVECFHKASLVHDDIEDNDDQRYGRPALHIQHGTPVALNVGDFLIGEGYRLISELDASDNVKAALLNIAAAGHLTLCRGQGAELSWTRDPQPLTIEQVLDIFRQKTAPAFEVALRMGACLAGADDNTHNVLTNYSRALGTAYQIRDDLDDFTGQSDSDDLRDTRPSAVLAVAHQHAATDAERRLTTTLWNRAPQGDDHIQVVHDLIARRNVIPAVEDLLADNIAQAIAALQPLTSPELKRLLRRVIGKIFGDDQIKGYCSEQGAPPLSAAEGWGTDQPRRRTNH